MNQRTDEPGRYGPFGGAYVPETLVEPLHDVQQAWTRLRQDAAFLAHLDHELQTYVGRPSPLTRAHRLEEAWGTAGPVYLKREDLNHTGAHKINNSLGQALLARAMGKKRIIAETGAGQHGVATATICARLGLACVVYMGAVDVERQALNVWRMRLLGAEVRPVESGTRTLKDAINEAMRDWVADPEGSYYLIGSALGPHPYPEMVRHFQSVIGREARAQYLAVEGTLPAHVVACVGGGSNGIGVWAAFLEDAGVALWGAEAGGDGVETGRHASRFHGGLPGVLHGTRTWLLQDGGGQIRETHSVSAGLDYPAVGPEHAWLHETGRVTYRAVQDDDALRSFHEVTRLEGIFPALESAHATALCRTLIEAGELGPGGILINMSGRGEKDIPTVQAAMDAAGGGGAP
jgi:tryptophan synthase beta chain